MHPNQSMQAAITRVTLRSPRGRASSWTGTEAAAQGIRGDRAKAGINRVVVRVSCRSTGERRSASRTSWKEANPQPCTSRGDAGAIAVSAYHQCRLRKGEISHNLCL